MKSFCTLVLIGMNLLRPIESVAQEKLGEFLGGVLLTSLIIIPSNPDPNDVSFSRYALGSVGGFIGVTFTGKYLVHKEGSLEHASWGGFLGGLAGGLYLYWLKATEEEETYGEPIYKIDVTPLVKPLAYLLLLIPPAFGASVGFNHGVSEQKALIECNYSQFVLNFPEINHTIRKDCYYPNYSVYQCKIFQFTFD